jgi:molybdopterin adenylyltransferase
MDPTHVKDIAVKAAVLTVSTSRTEKEDTSGKRIKELLEKDGIQVIKTKIIPDIISAIQEEVKNALTGANCIILTGGTGITKDDCTIEAVEPLIQKHLDGFGELFRTKSYAEVGTRTVLSRAMAGVTDGKVIFCVPGSFNAADLATREIIIPEVKHILTHANR